MPRYIPKKKILNYKPKRGTCHAILPRKNFRMPRYLPRIPRNATG